MPHTEFRLPAEWERQSGVLLAWPGAHSDWSENLDEVRREYIALVEAIVEFQHVVMLVPPDEPAPQGIPADRPGVHLIPVEYNDTWCRDYGPITLVGSGQRLALDFRFNGWGGKHPAELDNRVNKHLAGHDLFNRFTFRQYLLELEGGAIDSDGRGHLLVNWHCLRMRHPHLAQHEIEHELQTLFNTRAVLGIDIEPLRGDDTDGHIDTLARFATPESIVFQLRQETEHNDALRSQLEAMRNDKGSSFRLVGLPCPDDLDPELPASYVNFVLINGACLVPAYGSRQDDAARTILADLMPDRRIVAVPAAAMITQSGGPHCATMHIPAALE